MNEVIVFRDAADAVSFVEHAGLDLVIRKNCIYDSIGELIARYVPWD